MGSFDMSVGGATDHASIMDPAVQASTELRFGRTRVSNAYGSELLSLAVPVSVQYWNGSAFVTAVDDAATLLNASNVVLSAPLGALTGATGASASNTCVPPPLPTSITLTNGAGKLCLAKPGTRGNINLSISAPSYLPSNSAVANFGVYKSPLIYRRENY
jgi:MSHA biogenesis protein MshQ